MGPKYLYEIYLEESIENLSEVVLRYGVVTILSNFIFFLATRSFLDKEEFEKFKESYKLETFIDVVKEFIKDCKINTQQYVMDYGVEGLLLRFEKYLELMNLIINQNLDEDEYEEDDYPERTYIWRKKNEKDN